MDFVSLLGRQLKDDVILEILEFYDMPVVYDFDRTHEGMEDLYWAESQPNGFQFRFNEKQELDTIFLYMVERDGFTPIDRDIIEVPIYSNYDEAENDLESKNIPFTKSPGEPGSSAYKGWIKPNFGKYTVHYQFKNEAIRMITIGATKNA